MGDDLTEIARGTFLKKKMSHSLSAGVSFNLHSELCHLFIKLLLYDQQLLVDLSFKQELSNQVSEKFDQTIFHSRLLHTA